MTKRQKYYLLQKLIGVVFILAGVVVYVLEWAITMLVLGLPVGLGFIFTKKPVVINKLYFEMEEEKQRKRSKRS